MRKKCEEFVKPRLVTVDHISSALKKIISNRKLVMTVHLSLIMSKYRQS